MIILISLIIIIISFILGKHIFGYWFNHLFIYATSWALFAILYEIKLIRYTSISTETWLIVSVTFLIYVSGVLSVYLSRNIFYPQYIPPEKDKSFDITLDGGNLLIYGILFFSLLGLIGAIEHWLALVNEFGSIPAVLASAGEVYRMKVRGEDIGQIPYLYIFSYVAIFLGAIYSAYKNRISILVLVPFLGAIIKDISGFARAGIFFSFILFLLTFMITRYALKKIHPEWYRYNKKLIVQLTLIIFLVLSSVTLIKQVRGSFEEFKASSSSLNSLQGGIISPSIYLYFSSDIAVLSKYFEGEGEPAYFGQNTFLSFYNFLAKMDFVEKPPTFPKGYFMPIWSNSATYLRELHVDFGAWGLFIIPYLLGLFTTFYWFKFFSTYRVSDLLVLIYLNVIVSFSVFYMVTRLASWFLSFTVLLILLPITSRYLRNRFISA